MEQKPKQKSVKPDDPEQSKRFIEAARKAEANETEAGADRAFKKIASSKKASASSQVWVQPIPAGGKTSRRK
jgi:hypothetical protein